MSADRSAALVSIIVEGDTGTEAGSVRFNACLAALSREMWSFYGKGSFASELIIVGGDQPTAARSGSAALTWPGGIQSIPAPPRLDYYQKKNFGFRHSRGDIVVFIDSDLVAEPGWLEAIVAPFADRSKSVVVGRTHFEGRSLFERAVALFWIFETRVDRDVVRPTRRLVSNNIAFRRALFAALPFPDRPTYRGQCSELGAKLAQLGIVMWEATAARAAHPAAAGLRALAGRGFHAGRDAAAYRLIEGVADRSWAREWRRDRAAVRNRIALRSPLLGASAVDRGAARVIGAFYYAVKACGFLVANLRERHSTELRQEPDGTLPSGQGARPA